MTLVHKMCDIFANTGRLDRYKASHTKAPVAQLLEKLPVFSFLAVPMLRCIPAESAPSSLHGYAITSQYHNVIL